jgi:hypothetical protein
MPSFPSKSDTAGYCKGCILGSCPNGSRSNRLPAITVFKTAPLGHLTKITTHMKGNLKRKKGRHIVPITKKESFELQKYGHRYGDEGTLHKTRTSNPKYYMTESSKALKDLDKIRTSRITARYGEN